MTEPGFSLIEFAKTLVRERVAELTKRDEDPEPLFLWEGPYGHGYMPIGELMKGSKEKDVLATWMTAAMTVGRVTEAVHISTVWMLRRDTSTLTKEEAAAARQGFALQGKLPADQPDSVECIVLMHISNDTDEIVSAPVTRRKDKPMLLGEWETATFDPGKLRGRFGDAMHAGLWMVKEMPQEMVTIIDEGWAAGEQGDLIERFVKVTEGLRKADL